MEATAKTKITSFLIDLSDWERLERTAQEQDRSVSAVIRVAIRRYLDEQKQAA
jgi:predicted transcriptional regulator